MKYKIGDKLRYDNINSLIYDMGQIVSIVDIIKDGDEVKYQLDFVNNLLHDESYLKHNFVKIKEKINNEKF